VQNAPVSYEQFDAELPLWRLPWIARENHFASAGSSRKTWIGTWHAVIARLRATLVGSIGLTFLWILYNNIDTLPIMRLLEQIAR
jgi:hypothetical protein